jgi:hypothetical protein
MRYTEWKQEGSLFFWLYKSGSTSIGGCHMSWDMVGKSNLVDLLVLLERADIESYRTLVIQKPTKQKLQVPNFGQQCSAKTKLRIIVSESTGNFIVSDNWFELRLSKTDIGNFKKKILKSSSGHETCLSIGNDVINFWW